MNLKEAIELKKELENLKNQAQKDKEEEIKSAIDGIQKAIDSGLSLDDIKSIFETDLKNLNISSLEISKIQSGINARGEEQNIFGQRLLKAPLNASKRTVKSLKRAFLTRKRRNTEHSLEENDGIISSQEKKPLSSGKQSKSEPVVLGVGVPVKVEIGVPVDPLLHVETGLKPSDDVLTKKPATKNTESISSEVKVKEEDVFGLFSSKKPTEAASARNSENLDLSALTFPKAPSGVPKPLERKKSRLNNNNNNKKTRERKLVPGS